MIGEFISENALPVAVLRNTRIGAVDAAGSYLPFNRPDTISLDFAVVIGFGSGFAWPFQDWQRCGSIDSQFFQDRVAMVRENNDRQFIIDESVDD